MVIGSHEVALTDAKSDAEVDLLFFFWFLFYIILTSTSLLNQTPMVNKMATPAEKKSWMWVSE
jgi:hypothetical protein